VSFQNDILRVLFHGSGDVSPKRGTSSPLDVSKEASVVINQVSCMLFSELTCRRRPRKSEQDVMLAQVLSEVHDSLPAPMPAPSPLAAMMGLPTQHSRVRYCVT